MRHTIWVIGGDARSHWAAQALSASRFTVSTHDVPDEKSQILPDEIKIAVLPFPSFQGALIRGHSAVPMADLLNRLNCGSYVFGGLFGDWKGAITDRGAQAIDLYGSEPLSTANACLTAEGALQLAMENSPISLHGAKCLVIGYGRIGKCLAQKLCGLSADVTVAARKIADRSLAEAMGHLSDQTGIYLHGLQQYDFIWNTVPAEVLSSEQLEKISPNCLLLDLASRPGGFSPMRCQELGLHFCSAPGLPGRCSPKSAGILYAQSILSILNQEGV